MTFKERLQIELEQMHSRLLRATRISTLGVATVDILLFSMIATGHNIQEKIQAKPEPFTYIILYNLVILALYTMLGIKPLYQHYKKHQSLTGQQSE